MAQGKHAFIIAAVMAVVAIAGNQGQARPVVPDGLPTAELVAD